MAEQEKVHEKRIEELDAMLNEKVSECRRLDEHLTVEKKMKEQLEEQRSVLLKQYEDERSGWQGMQASFEDRLNKQQGAIRERVPFDPFGEAPLIVLNAVKSDSKTRDK